MAQQPARRARNLRVVKGRQGEAPVLDLAEGLQVYFDLLNQTRQLQAITEELRGRLLRAMETMGLFDFESDGIQAVRQVRHLPARLDRREAERILREEVRLAEAQSPMLDPEKAREALDDLYVKGKLKKEELPYAEPRDVEVLIVRSAEEQEE
jgi:hypothetical protein